MASHVDSQDIDNSHGIAEGVVQFKEDEHTIRSQEKSCSFVENQKNKESKSLIDTTGECKESEAEFQIACAVTTDRIAEDSEIVHNQSTDNEINQESKGTKEEDCTNQNQILQTISQQDKVIEPNNGRPKDNIESQEQTPKNLDVTHAAEDTDRNHTDESEQEEIDDTFYLSSGIDQIIDEAFEQDYKRLEDPQATSAKATSVESNGNPSSKNVADEVKYDPGDVKNAIEKEVAIEDEFHNGSSQEVIEDDHNQGNALPIDRSLSTKIYQIKWIQWKGKSTPIVMQNINGPCPLIAIMNILLLTQKMQFPVGQEYTTTEVLMQQLVSTLLALRPKAFEESLDYDRNVNDAISSLDSLQTGVDINVKFCGITQFEWTSNLIVFDLLDINLYHGWLVDPQNSEEHAVLANRSYNELVEMIISSKSSDDSKSLNEGYIAEQFLKSNASQLTYHGLYTLYAEIKPEELCVLFRNNHCSTIYKHNNELFILVTDIGYANENEVVWETLCNIEGDSFLVNGDFKTVTPQGRSSRPAPIASMAPEKDIEQLPIAVQSAPKEPVKNVDDGDDQQRLLSQEDLDYLIALQQQQQEDVYGEHGEHAIATGEYFVHESEKPAHKIANEPTSVRKESRIAETPNQINEKNSEAMGYKPQFDKCHESAAVKSVSKAQASAAPTLATSSNSQTQVINQSLRQSPQKVQSMEKAGNCSIL